MSDLSQDQDEDQTETWPHPQPQFTAQQMIFRRNAKSDFQFLANQISVSHYIDDTISVESGSPSDLAADSLSDITRQSETEGTRDFARKEISPKMPSVRPALQFLPPVLSREISGSLPHSFVENKNSHIYFQDRDCVDQNEIQSLTADKPCDDEYKLSLHDDDHDDDATNPQTKHLSSALMPGTETYLNLDFISMKGKLEAHKEYVLGSFQKQNRLPQTLSTFPAYPSVEKPGSRKIKERVQKFGKMARQFWNSKIFRRHPAVRRCEIHIQGLDDRSDDLFFLLCIKGASCLNISMSSFFEDNVVTVPGILLPCNPLETITISVYGITFQKSGLLSNFSEVLFSGVCTVQTDTAVLLGQLELQPHRPCHAMTNYSKILPRCGCNMRTEECGNNSYTFSTLPKPVARDFTELCVLQTAEPFHEYFILAASNCDSPACFNAQLLPGKYHAVCIYRLIPGSVSRTFSVISATPNIFFKTCISLAETANKMKTAAELVEHGINKEPVLLPFISALKTPEHDLEALLKTLNAHQRKIQSNSKLHASDLNKGEQYLYLCVLDKDKLSSNEKTKQASTLTNSWLKVNDMQSPMANCCLSNRNMKYISLPTISVFNMSTRLYFADYWNYYDKHHVTLVLCKKGSPCHQICKKHFCKLDPYNNPFLFRKRLLDPEPSIAVYVTSNVSVEVIYSDTDKIKQIIFACSENVYFSKVRVVNE